MTDSTDFVKDEQKSFLKLHHQHRLPKSSQGVTRTVTVASYRYKLMSGGGENETCYNWISHFCTLSGLPLPRGFRSPECPDGDASRLVGFCSVFQRCSFHATGFQVKHV